MTDHSSYWARTDERFRSRISRRGMLRGMSIGAAGLAGAALIGCGDDDDDDGAAATQATAAPTKAAAAATKAPTSAAAPEVSADEAKVGGTLHRTAGKEPVQWDQHTQTAAAGTTSNISYMHVNLLQYDHDHPDYRYGSLRVKGQVAESWEVLDKRTYLFKLNKGIKWDSRSPTNGRELVAGDVKFTWDRFYGSDFLKGVQPQPPPEAIEVVDDYTLKVTLPGPNSQWLNLAANGNLLLYAHEVEDTFGDYKIAENQRGAGPYKLKKWVPGSLILFERNPDYFRNPRPYVEEIEIVIGPDRQAALEGFRNGRFDIASVRANDLESMQKSLPDAGFAQAASCCAPSLLINTQRAPTNDPRVRRALSMSFDRKLWLERLYKGAGEIVTSVFTSLFLEYLLPFDELSRLGQKTFTYDPAESRKLLAAALPDGFEGSQGIEMYPGGASYEQQTQLVMEFLSEIGIKTNLVAMEYGAFISGTYAGKFDGFGYGPSGAFSPGEILSKYIPGTKSRNTNHVDDAVINDWIEDFWVAESQEESIEICKKVQNRSAEEALYIMGVSGHSFRAWQSWVKGWDGKPDTAFNHGVANEKIWIEKA